MPEGTPRTDEEREQRHREVYGDEDIPEERGKSPTGEGATAARKETWVVWVKAVLVIAIFYFLWVILKRGGVL
ncbi:MAG: hypothetical protein KAW41_01185 [Candidatus Diapherotrites archaeon]|nr:hypothetical protein [Candidatus Diapherotrites archaeon]